MKYIKIILGLLLFISASTEYVEASLQLGNFFSGGVIIGISVLLCISVWLFKSGLKKNEVKFLSLKFLKYYISAYLVFIPITIVNLYLKTLPPMVIEGEDLLQSQIDSTSNEDLSYLVYDNLLSNLPNDYRGEYEIVSNWNEPRKAIYLINLLESEVNNGGFNQFYYNSSGQFYKLMPDAFQTINALELAKLTEQANQIYESNYKEVTEHQGGTLEGFSKSYKDNPLETFDSQFYELVEKERLSELKAQFIRKNSIDFITKTHANKS
ncbi:DMP19 family protein [Flammeovirga kamogawensis]|uniref:DMP19 family protein n=1 Tax=Flammeovirga kamogawensis TaxID=373891 RepID=A0ABX8H1Y2_9BACT|nr:DUF4375 domain-containing protein [Flammeovirga kamogawensis]MBB6464110.1 hypothetical protein [Flammeovirga kamogawensis]QWG09909.1 DMP19 family protein [Flammeovirga kamogawensis]TRX65413.1 DUF4375 domain-containing protein [Flammeovirga kamogawensis]